ncbi:MAG: HIT domain-containing protein [Deltaproteobacteria bacterium]|nr:HIT domain-containing protein [Deltaproteobacteria bacterium]
MKQLWAPWRMAYIDEEAKDPGCIFCLKPLEPDPRAALVLAQTEHTVVMMNKYPYNNGHLLLAPKSHENDLSHLSGDAFSDLNEKLRQAIAIVRRVFNPGGVNLGMNLGKYAGAGIEAHLHWHIVPRGEGDTNFMPVLGETRVMPQHLFDSFDRLAPHFNNLPM